MKGNAFLQDNELPKIDWSDLWQAHEKSLQFLDGVSADPDRLARMVEFAWSDPDLRAMCEQGVVEDKIVLADHPELGWRLQIRMASTRQQEMSHQHRFSFATKVLKGAYLHRIYHYDGEFGTGTDYRDVSTVYLNEDGPGTTFCIDHRTIHSTPLIEAGSILLVLRGPAVKDRAPVIFREVRGDPNESEVLTTEMEPLSANPGTIFFRIGVTDENRSQRREIPMTADVFAHWKQLLISNGIITASEVQYAE